MRRRLSVFVGRPASRWPVIIGTTILGAIWLLILGPTPVLRGSTPLAEHVPYWYMLAAFPVLGMLIADLAQLVATEGTGTRSIELALQLAVLILVSAARLLLRLPISGHTLLYSAYFTRELQYEEVASRLELSLVVVLFVATSYIKLLIWSDPVTWAVGVAAGVILVVASRTALRAGSP